MLLNIP